VGYLSDMAQQGYNTQNISDFHKKMVPYLIKKYACASKKDLIVDIGSGQGHALIPLWNEGYSNLVAIDIEADNFEEFELKYNIRSHVCNIENQKIPMEDKSAKIIMSLHLIEHLTNPDNFLNEAFRILRDDGHIFIVTPNSRKQVKTFYRDPTHRHPYDYLSLSRIMRIHGFSDVNIYNWNSRYGFGRIKAYILFPRLGMIGKDLLAHANKCIDKPHLKI
jgi:2-polyprenyl-3-methyl-5-hydroxy-6-metoxy-1,4-benzoquinol methylase